VDDDAPSLEHLTSGVAFIRGVVAAGGKVYIHCGAGVGRAPTMAAAYLISEGHSLESALALVRSARPFITITPPQMARLEEWAGIHHSASADAGASEPGGTKEPASEKNEAAAPVIGAAEEGLR
jgi:protein-tyrosine phosphatase